MVNQAIEDLRVLLDHQVMLGLEELLVPLVP